MPSTSNSFVEHSDKHTEVKGYVDVITAKGVSGWAFRPSSPLDRLSIDVFTADKKIAAGLAANFRHDLASAGMGDGYCAFNVDFPEPVSPDRLDQVGVACAGTWLPRSPTAATAATASNQTVGRAARTQSAPQHGTAPAEMWFFYPDYTSTNPYQSLVANALPEDISISAGTIDQAIEAAAGLNGNATKVVFHLHWTTPIVAGGQNEYLANRRVEEFLAKLRRFTSLGGTIIWTIHNVLSHDGQYKVAEQKLCKAIVELASRIHIHSSLVLDAVSNFYQVPAHKTVVIPHPNYVGVYSNYVDSALARKRYGLADDAPVFAFIGQLRPYKGLRELIDAFRQLQQQLPAARLIIAGKPVLPYTVGTVRDMMQDQEGVIVIEKHIADADLQWVFNACDFVVLPYQNVLTSGSALNALSFSRPVIAPRLGLLPDLIKEGENGFLYSADDRQGLLSALIQAATISPLEREAMQKQAFASIEKETWQNFGAALASSIKQSRASHEVTVDTAAGTRSVQASRIPGPRARQAKVAVIILNYNNIDDSRRLIASLEQSSCQDMEIFLVDNDSCNLNIVDLENCKPKHIDFTWIKTKSNLGYAAGNNVGLAFIRPQQFDYIWVLNPDIEVLPDTLDEFVKATANYPKVNVFGAAISYGHQKEKIWYAGATVDFTYGLKTEHQFNGLNPSMLPTHAYPTDYITGASLFCRPEAFLRGGDIPEDYFLYFEETDWCLALKQQGEQLLVVPAARLYHHKRSEDNGLPTAAYFYYYVRNALNFARKYAPHSLRNTAANLQRGFIQKWLEKIENTAPQRAATFAILAEAALADGRAGRTGQRDLPALIVGLPQHPATDTNFVEVHIDSWGDGAVHGWAINRQQPQSRLNVYLFVDGEHVATQSASEFRQDLLEHQVGDGRHAFSFTPDMRLFDGYRHRLTLYVEGSTEKYEASVVATYREQYIGRIDGLTNFIVRGWAHNKYNHQEKVEVELVANGAVVATGLCDLPRSDLIQANIGYGDHGFEIRVPAQVASEPNAELTLRLAGNGAELFRRQGINAVLPAQLPAGDLAFQLNWIFQHREFRSYAGDVAPALSYFESCEKTLRSRYSNRAQSSKVSIIMPAFNRETTILGAIASVCAQSYRNFELIVIDDGSQDRTVEVISDYIEAHSENRIKLIPLEKNVGVSAARNAGLDHAEGEIIAYLDSDNDWEADFLLIMANSLLDAPDSQSAYCGQKIWHVVRQNDTFREEQITIRTGHFWLSLLENRNYIDLNCFVHRRELASKLGGFNENLRRLVDWDLIWRYALESAPAFVPVLLSRYFMEKADNQITKLEDFQSNLQALRAGISDHKRGLAQKTAPGEIDVFLAFEQGDSPNLNALESLMNVDGSQVRNITVAIPAQSIDSIDKKIFLNNPKVTLTGYACEALPQLLQATSVQAQQTKGLLVLSPRAALDPFCISNLLETFEMDAAAGAAIGRTNVSGRNHRKVWHFATAAHPIDVVFSYAPPVLMDRTGINSQHLFEVTQLPYFATLIPQQTLSDLDLEAFNSQTMLAFHDQLHHAITWLCQKHVAYNGRAESRLAT